MREDDEYCRQTNCTFILGLVILILKKRTEYNLKFGSEGVPTIFLTWAVQAMHCIPNTTYR